jgi:hypothetical protein
MLAGQEPVVILSSGIARAQTERIKIGVVNGIPLFRSVTGEAEGLPAVEHGTIYVVSSLTAQAAPHRKDVYFPDDVIRDDIGRVIGCRSLSRIS